MPANKETAKKETTNDKMDAISLLKADHRKVEDLFEKFESAKSGKEKIAQQICLELMVHATIEEEIFYPACTGKIEDPELIQEAYVEHDSAKVLISEIMTGGAKDEFYDAKVKVLSEMIKHHVKEEEMRAEGLFAEAKDAGLDMDALGEQMAARKEELMAEYKSGLPTPQTRSFKGTELEHGEPVKQAA